ncbi:MAG: hypothetical protein A2138_09170 [Deltaproteobacteria bacterium RBG_16_71_12]|nr:MAG: hypothetical protein A2138_09170 [Deltaproteobacteria bacterium RBG_16_71_12]
MPLIAFGGARAQTGKSTAAALVGSQLVAEGKRVLLVDTAPNQAALRWSAKAGSGAPTTIASYPQDAEALLALGAAFEVTLVDLPSDPLVQRRLLPAADLVVVPWPHGTDAVSLPRPDVRRARVLPVRVPLMGSQTPPGKLVPLGATLRADARLAAVLADGLGVTDLDEAEADVVRVAAAVLAALSDDGTPVADLSAFVRDMQTFVGRIERSLQDMSVRGRSTEEQRAGVREVLTETIAAARQLLGLHFKHGETFMVNDGLRFYEVAEAAHRLMDGADRLLGNMREREETTGEVPSVSVLLSDARRLVRDLEKLRHVRA